MRKLKLIFVISLTFINTDLLLLAQDKLNNSALSVKYTMPKVSKISVRLINEPPSFLPTDLHKNPYTISEFVCIDINYNGSQSMKIFVNQSSSNGLLESNNQPFTYTNADGTKNVTFALINQKTNKKILRGGEVYTYDHDQPNPVSTTVKLGMEIYKTTSATSGNYKCDLSVNLIEGG